MTTDSIQYPIVKITIEQMEHLITTLIGDHFDLIGSQIKAAVEKELQRFDIGKAVADIVPRLMNAFLVECTQTGIKNALVNDKRLNEVVSKTIMQSMSEHFARESKLSREEEEWQQKWK